MVVSEPLVEQAVSLGADPRRVLFYPNGIDPLVFDPARFTAEEKREARQTLGVPLDADLLTFVGTFGTWHGTDVLATAIQRLIAEARDWLEATARPLPLRRRRRARARRCARSWGRASARPS